jgi:hypothetical protein
MGQNSIIAVLGLLLIFSIVTRTLNQRTVQGADNTYGYVDYTAARDIARNSIQVALRKIDTLKTVTAFTIAGNLDGGSYSVAGTIIDSITIRLQATSRFIDSTYAITATLQRKSNIFPSWVISHALGLHAIPDSFSFQGNNSHIDGRDHDSVGNVLPTSPDSVPAIKVMDPGDSATVRRNISSTLYANNVIGTPKVMVDNTILDPNTFADAFKTVADTIFTNNANGDMTINTDIGTPSSPKIVYLDGGSIHSFQWKSSGWGILVVKGNVKFNSNNAVWHGLVIVYGNAAVSFNASVSNNTQVIGGVLMGGLGGSSYQIGGNSEILYSRSNLLKATNQPRAELYFIVDWYE